MREGLLSRSFSYPSSLLHHFWERHVGEIQHVHASVHPEPHMYSKSQTSTSRCQNITRITKVGRVHPAFITESAPTWWITPVLSTTHRCTTPLQQNCIYFTNSHHIKAQKASSLKQMERSTKLALPWLM